MISAFARVVGEGTALSSSAVAIRGLVMRFGSRTLFDGFDLDVPRGERLAILGASGCGKSTLLRCIAGLEKPQAGHIQAAGEIGFVFQEPRLFPWLTVEGNVTFAARNELERERVADILELVGLTAARALLPKQLSGGMAQRAALARTLVRQPDIILLDEPLAALDALRRLELRAALREIVIASGATAVLVTHDVDEAIDVGNRCVVLDRTDGKAQLVEPPSGSDIDTRRVLLAALGVPMPGGFPPGRSR